MRVGFRARTLLIFFGVAVLACAGCVRDAREGPLRETVSQAVSMVKARGVREAVRKQDPQMRPSSVVGMLMAQGVIAQHPPPDGIAFTIGRYSHIPWCVVIRADDEARAVIVDGYGVRTDRPEVTERIEFEPPAPASPTPRPRGGT